MRAMFRQRLSWTGLAAAVTLAAAGVQGWEPFRFQPDPTRFDKTLARYAESDRASPPAPGGILFLGSSSIRKWTSLTNDFAGLPVLNRGFGGSEFSDALALLDRLVFPYAPRQIVLYEGDNDTWHGRSPEDVLRDFQTFVRRVHARLPSCRITVLAIKPCPKRWFIARTVREANARLKAAAAANPLLDFVDTFSPLLGPDGRPRAELYTNDRVHLNADGYAIWTELIRPHLH